MDQKKITRDIRKYLQLNDNEKQTCQYLWDAVKALCRGKFIALIVYIKNEEKLKFTV